MPDYADRNSLDATGELPDLYWSGETDIELRRPGDAGRPGAGVHGTTSSA